MPSSFDAALAARDLSPLQRGPARVLQLNLTRRCNLACHHCHVESSPRRTEAMDARTVARALELLAASPGIEVVDLTGGAPEMHGSFRELVREARRLGRRVMDRCNLTILQEPGHADTAEFLAAHQVEVVASLPCYQEGNVDGQRGRGVFERSIAALQALNALGYGGPDSPLALDLVYNPVGPSLPPAQAALEADYRRELGSHYGIAFRRLLTLTNMPIRRHAEWLARRGELARYQALLVNHFNPETLPGLMCRDTVSVDWRGELFDCDFNQALDLPLGEARRTLWSVSHFGELTGLPIATGEHCFGCTAGAGSSCGGALVQ
ncbi:MAG TPA: arsenosugar biosynthesis radical SAM (seleno)protein ArsS [Myxococcota bacterium]|nr:arsenosugar biosynthesis radical SAM (seleno)protein ArsS [Myxococcota bacterium]